MHEGDRINDPATGPRTEATPTKTRAAVFVCGNDANAIIAPTTTNRPP